eukprot:gene11780-8390_t
MSADTLTPASRDFYERAKGKVALSIAVSAIGLAFLGFTACAGGEASAANNSLDYDNLSSDQKASYHAILGGSGFATFVFILAFFVMTSAAVYISPLINGSANEKKVLRAPQEIDTGLSYSDSDKN